ncbi:hypothetical protein Xmau_00569 [Xenorhabdus mauleonii]|uniref:Uncharacterized protein n=1 Tax=Xenorhabdus mauleonii TaxID=351675 RepID=A0A1I3JD84_9GAMM|nr:hypothetical protein Xmau_00569 [Xenorhabdus mauleonii]SFI58106.1 hypothetical protein SAMN05421680_102164 [Xenorhabdus mauleonii]
MRLIFIYPDAYAFEEPHRKEPSKNRLTIVCHGGRSRDGIPKIKINDIRYNAADIAQRIRRWTVVSDLYSVRLAICRSADINPYEDSLVIIPALRRYPPWTTSFGSQLSLFLPNIFVRAYMGRIVTTCGPNSVWYRSALDGWQYVQNRLPREFRIFKNLSTPHYHCVVFLNGRFYRQSYNHHPPPAP